MSAINKARLLKTKPIKSQANYYPEEEAAKLKLIQYSENQYNNNNGKDSSQKFSILLDTNTEYYQRNQKNSKTQNSSRKQSKLIYLVPKSYISAQFKKLNKRQCENLKDLSKDKFSEGLGNKSLSNASPRKNDEILIRHPVSLSNYLVTGSHSTERTSSSAPKSDYIIRQRRNCRKIKRIKQKRQTQQLENKNNLFDKMIGERQAYKMLNMKTIFLANKHKFNKFNLTSRQEQKSTRVNSENKRN